jgi:hypothetical protein
MLGPKRNESAVNMAEYGDSIAMMEPKCQEIHLHTRRPHERHRNWGGTEAQIRPGEKILDFGWYFAVNPGGALWYSVTL